MEINQVISILNNRSSFELGIRKLQMKTFIRYRTRGIGCILSSLSNFYQKCRGYCKEISEFIDSVCKFITNDHNAISDYILNDRIRKIESE